MRYLLELLWIKSSRLDELTSKSFFFFLKVDFYKLHSSKGYNLEFRLALMKELLRITDSLCLSTPSEHIVL